MGRFFESPMQRAVRSHADEAIKFLQGLYSGSPELQRPFDVEGRIKILNEIFNAEKSYLASKTAEYLASQGLPEGTIKAVNLVNALMPLSIERMRQELGILNLADQYNLQKLGTKHSIANSLANLYLAKAQAGYSRYSPFDVILATLHAIGNVARGFGSFKTGGQL